MSRNIRGSYASECEDFYNVTSCNLVQRYEHFTGIRCLHFQGKKVRPLRAYILYSLLLSSVNFLRSLVPILPLCTTVMFFVFFSHLAYSSTLKMEESRLLQMLVIFYQTTIPEDRNLHYLPWQCETSLTTKCLHNYVIVYFSIWCSWTLKAKVIHYSMASFQPLCASSIQLQYTFNYTHHGSKIQHT
jgi:hypothetical protein